MANFNKYFPVLLQLEGTTLENVPGDSGSWTMDGITIAEYKVSGIDHNHDGIINQIDLGLMTNEEASKIAKSNYWDQIQGDNIISQSVAEMLCDYGYNCGIRLAIKKIQGILNLSIDGNFGIHTLGSVNSSNPLQLFNKIKLSRLAYYQAIVDHNPSQIKFLRGWQNRVNNFKFIS